MGSMIYAVDVMRDDTARMDTAAEAVEEGSGALGWVAPLDCTELLAAAANNTANRTSGPTDADALLFREGLGPDVERAPARVGLRLVSGDIVRLSSLMRSST